MKMSFTLYMTNKLSVRVNVKNPEIFKWLFGTVWSPSGGLGGRHKASVAMAVWQEQRRILALQPNATLIFSLANLQLSLDSLFVSQSSPLLSVTLQLLPTPHANLKSAAALCKEGKCVKTPFARETVPEMGLLPAATARRVRRDKRQIKHDFSCDSSNGFINSTANIHFQCKTHSVGPNYSHITPQMYARLPSNLQQQENLQDSVTASAQGHTLPYIHKLSVK